MNNIALFVTFVDGQVMNPLTVTRLITSVMLRKLEDVSLVSTIPITTLTVLSGTTAPMGEKKGDNVPKTGDCFPSEIPLIAPPLKRITTKVTHCTMWRWNRQT